MAKRRLYIDQYGQQVWADTVKELAQKAGGGKVSRMYVDLKDGRTVHCGYVVGRRWFNGFEPMREDAKQ